MTLQRSTMRTWGLVAALTLVVAAVLAAGAQGTSTKATAPTATPPTKVKVGIGPYLDYVPWLVAHQLGFDREFGLDLKTSVVQTPQLAGPLLKRGDLEVSYSCQACNFPILKAIPELRDWLITNQFKGFAIVGRKGTPTFDSLVAKGMSGPAARKAVLRSLYGKEFVMVTANFRALLGTAMKEVNLDPSEVKILDFADDSKAALAVIGGTGDFYMGSLPQTTKMLQDYSKDFVKVGGNDILGPGGLWYSTAIALQPWLDKNQETAVRLQGVWYRTMRYLAAKPDSAVPLMTKEINKLSASKFTPQTVKFLMTNLLQFSTITQAKAKTFDPASINYHRKSVNFYAKGNAKVLPAGYKGTTYFIEDTWFKKLLGRPDLIKLINAPLKAN